MPKNKITILFVFLAIGLFIAGTQMYGLFLSVLLFPFTGFMFHGYPTSHQFIHVVLFAGNLATIPLLAAILGKSAKEKWLSLMLLFVFMMVAVFSRQVYLSSLMNDYHVESKANTRVTYLVSLEYTNYEAYMTAGLIVGYCLLFFYFKRLRGRGKTSLQL